jgi:hypothetical protein
MSALSFSDLVELGNAVESLPVEEYNTISSFSAYSDDSTEDTLRSARGFLRHTIKCTALFAGDGYTRTEAHARGAKEFLVPRCAVQDLPGHRWIELGGSETQTHPEPAAM